MRAAAWVVAFLLVNACLAATATAQEGEARRMPSEASRIWWNQPRFVDGLALTAEQRTGMDAALERHRAARRDKGRSYQQARGAVVKAAQAGNWEAAEAAQARFGEAAAEMGRLELDLVVDVLRLMNDSQRSRLEAEFPVLLRRPWLFGGAGRFGAARRGAARQPGGR